MAKILVVDDEAKMAKLLAAQLADAGHETLHTTSPREALTIAVQEKPDIIVTDLKMEEMDGLELLKKIKETSPDTDVIMMTAYASVDTAIETMKLGAYDYITKPFSTEELTLLLSRLEEKRRLERENLGLRSYIAGQVAPEIVGESEAMRRVRKLVHDLRGSEVTVLIRGESGTGKELVARAIHRYSRRSRGPFVALNCAAIPETLLESELFGHEKGAFTGAERRRLGHFLQAQGGTLFLDEIGELPVSLQAKLLRVLEERKVRPLGSDREFDVDIRLISATNRPLEEEIKKGNFREDLYYRLNVFPIHLPPLREHREDIRDLAEHFLRAAGRDPRDLSEGALRKLIQYHWPGNIRELRNVLERATIVRPQGKITAEDIILSGPPEEEETGSLNLEEMEKKLILRALRAAGGNKSEAARLLGITRRALYGRLARYGIEETP